MRYHPNSVFQLHSTAYNHMLITLTGDDRLPYSNAARFSVRPHKSIHRFGCRRISTVSDSLNAP